MNPIIVKLLSKASEIMIQNTSNTVFNKINTAKEKLESEQAISALEDIINDLLEDKKQLNQIIKSFEEILAVQKISDQDINYITTNIVPILSKLLENELLTEENEEKAEEMRQTIELLTPILSEETLTILQLLGFNFREAIGVPLTNFVRKAIDKTSTEKLQYENNIASNNAQAELFKLLQTEEGRQAFKDLNVQD